MYPAWLLTFSEFEIAFNKVENWLTLSIPNSYLTFVEIRADTEDSEVISDLSRNQGWHWQKIWLEKLVYKMPDDSRNKLKDSHHFSTIDLKGSILPSVVLTSDVVTICECPLGCFVQQSTSKENTWAVQKWMITFNWTLSTPNSQILLV